MPAYRKKKCPTCGRIFVGVAHQVHCSMKCRPAPVTQKSCLFCGRDYVGHVAQRFCSWDCSAKCSIRENWGKRFGDLLILRKYPKPLWNKKKNGPAINVWVRCFRCGGERVMRLGGILYGTSKGCGCRIRLVKIKSGQRYGRWTVVWMVSRSNWHRNKNGSTVPSFLCRCDCGVERIVRGNLLRVGGSKSCGCYRREVNRKTAIGRRKNKTPIPHRTLMRIRNSADKRDIHWSKACLDEQYLWQLFQRQGKKCALTGAELCFHRDKYDYGRGSASLDRIDSSRGYVQGNVWWVHKWVNRCKERLDVSCFVDMCYCVVECVGGEVERKSFTGFGASMFFNSEGDQK